MADRHPDHHQCRHAWHPAGSDRASGQELGGFARSRIQGQGSIAGSAHRRRHRCRYGARSARRPQIRQQGEHDARGDRQDHQYDDGGQEIRTVPLVLVEFRSVGQSDGVGRGGDPVDVVAGGTAVKARGIPCVFQPLQEGYRGWGYTLAPMKHLAGLKLDCFYEYMNWYTSGFQGAFIARQGYYSSVPEHAKKFLSEAEWDYWYGGKPAAADITDPYGKLMEKAGNTRDGGAFWDRMGNIAVWNSVMDEDRYLTRRWNEFITS